MKSFNNMNLVKSLLPASILSMGLTSCDRTVSITEKPNVVFLVVDDMGWTDVARYGSDFHQTPHIDALADDGVMFTNAYSSSTVCSPTRAALMTGKNPAKLNITDWITGWIYPWAKLSNPDWTMYLDTTKYTLAKAFRDNQYRTGHFGKWHLGMTEEYWPENHGFDINVGGYFRGAPHRNQNQGYNGYFSPYGNPRLEDGPEGEYLTERLSGEVASFIKEHKDEPFFVNFWFYNVHTPLQAREEKIKKYRDLADPDNNHRNPVYAAMVEHTDDAVGVVINQLKKAGIYDNTIIIFTSDNGGLIGNPNRPPVTSNYPLRHGKGSEWEGGVRVPLIIAGPGIPPGRVSHELAISEDFFPTVNTLANLRVPDNVASKWCGVDLSPVLRDQNEKTGRDAVFFHYPHYHIEGATPHSAIRKGDFKLYHFYENTEYELYNLADDIGETNNIANEKPEVFDDLRKDLHRWLKEVDAQLPLPNPDYDPERAGRRN